MAFVVALGVAAAFVYGTSDFLGGFAARQISSMQVTFLAFLAGTATCGLLAPFLPTNWSSRAIDYGALSGLAGAASIWLLYGALSQGAMSVTAPLVAVIAALTPVLYGLAHHERLGVVGELAVGAVLIAAVLLAYDPNPNGSRPSTRNLSAALAAGVATGAYLICLDLTPTNSGAVPILIEFAVGTGLLALVVAITRAIRMGGARTRSAGSGAFVRVAVISGVTQAVADIFVIVGIHRGHLAVMGALLALYPVGTLVCARIVTQERLSRLQRIGVIVAIAAAAALGVVGR